MNKVYEFPNQDKVNDEASLWLARLDRGLSDVERSALQQWMAQDKLHRQTLFKMAEIWDKMDSLSRLSELFPAVAKKPSAVSRYRYTASIAVMLMGLAGWFFLQMGQEGDLLVSSEGNVYETSVGGHSLVNLPDNSKVLLNTDSLIRVHYSDTERYIVMGRGEAHFTVAKDNSRPFTVQAGDKIIQAVGTAFNVTFLDKNSVSLIVTEGKVALVDKLPSIDVQKRLNPARLSQVLPTVSQGEAAVLGVEETTIKKLPQDKIAARLSWQQGNLVFQGETLEEAIREISRYTTIEFQIVDEKIKKVRVAGLFKSDDIDGLLVTLSENFDIASRKTGEGRILLGVDAGNLR